MENKDGTFIDSPMKGLVSQDDELNTPQYPELKKAVSPSEKPVEKPSDLKPKQKRRSLIKLNTETKKVIRPILPKPMHHSAKEKLKAFILKDLSPVIVEKSPPTKNSSLKTSKSLRKSNKPTESNREAAKRYRERVKLLQQQLEEDNLRLRRENSELIKENNALKTQLRQLLMNQRPLGE